MLRKILVIAGWVALIGAMVFISVAKPDFTRIKNWAISFYGNPLESLSDSFGGVLKEIHNFGNGSAVSAPPPLKSNSNRDAAKSVLTVLGTIAQTNTERGERGLPPLAENSRLALAAMEKVNDMFAKQYFEHISPSGVGPSELAKSLGYAYILVGENLALGNFANDADLVTAWMNSPGHRANILNTRYMEIGVAVKRGNFEGKNVWLAVQEFGKPLSSCPPVSAELKTSIDSNQSRIAALSAELDRRKEELDSYENKRSAEYRQKVDEYNDLVVRYNSLIEDTKLLISEYNIQVEAFNNCVKA